MLPKPIIIVNDDSTFQEALEHKLVDSPYELTPFPSSTSLPTSDEHPHAAAVVANLSSEHCVEQKQTLRELLDDEPQMPALVCSDRPAALQSVIKELSSHPGAVHASSPDVNEICAKLDYLT